jgi:hypothetical protein
MVSCDFGTPSHPAFFIMPESRRFRATIIHFLVFPKGFSLKLRASA